jgi:hypothetical protein
MNQMPHAHVFAKEVETSPLPFFFLFFQISMSITTHAITLHKSGNTLYNMSLFPSLFPFCSLLFFFVILMFMLLGNGGLQG